MARKKKVDKIEFTDDNKTLEFTPNLYQQAIFDKISEGNGNIVINARAGSGKTSTIVNAIKLISEDKRILFVAFNKDIVAELKKRIGKRSNIDIMTYHSLGYAILRDNFRDIAWGKPDDYKYRTFVKNNIGRLSNNNVKYLNKTQYYIYINNITHLIDYARYNLHQSPAEILNDAKKYDISIIDDECEIVSNLLKWGQNTLTNIDYTDMVWLPNELMLNTRHYQYDFIFIDEMQDTSIMQQGLFQKCFKRGTRFVAVSDNFQMINAWAGADSDAYQKICSLPNTEILPLPISYRCDKKIISMAQAYVPDIEARPEAGEGEILIDCVPSIPQAGDMVLCRNTAPLIRLYMNYLRINKKSYIRGKDIGSNLVKLIRDTKKTILSKSLIVDGVFPQLYEKLFAMRDGLIMHNGLDKEDATMSENVMNFYDAIKSLEVLSEGLQNSEELIGKIQTIFSDKTTNGVCLSTIHKAKGLESNNVYILCPSLMPSKYAKSQWEKDAEQNLIYVAITRAKHKLGYISEKKFPPIDGSADISIEKILDSIEKKMKRKTEFNNANNTDDLVFMEDKKNNDNSSLTISNNNNRKKIGALKFNNLC